VQESGAEQEDATYPINDAQSIPEKPVAAAVFAETAENGVLVPADDVYAEYEYTEHDELGDGEYGEIPLIEDNLPEAMSIMCGHSETLELAGTGGATPRLSDLASDPEHTTGKPCIQATQTILTAVL
jgi:hypothetical protein